MTEPKKTGRAALAIITALVWAAAFANSTYRFKLSAKAQIGVSLTTKPDAVRLTIDGERQFNGAYAVTPLKIAVPPGRHKLKIFRDGYVAHVVTVEGDSGEQFKMDDVVLQKNPDLTFGHVEISADGPTDGAVYVEVDDGLVRGDLPLQTDELTSFSEHTLAIYPKGRQGEAKLRCRFTPQGNGEGAGHQILLKFKGDQPRAAAGCDKLSKKH